MNQLIAPLSRRFIICSTSHSLLSQVIRTAVISHSGYKISSSPGWHAKPLPNTAPPSGTLKLMLSNENIRALLTDHSSAATMHMSRSKPVHKGVHTTLNCNTAVLKLLLHGAPKPGKQRGQEASRSEGMFTNAAHASTVLVSLWLNSSIVAASQLPRAMLSMIVIGPIASFSVKPRDLPQENRS